MLKQGTRRLVNQNDSAIIEAPNVARSRFTNAWTRKTAFDASYLVPMLVDELLPGDHVTYNITAFIRLSTPLFPMLDNMRIDTFVFFVPARLLWENWTKFMGEQSTPASSIAYAVPQVGTGVGGAGVGSIYDHMGIPTAGQIDPAMTLYVNALPFRAYNKIWNAWFRDQNIQNSVTELVDNGVDPFATYNLLRRAKSADYFTTALPWPQKFTAPNIPLLGTAPIIGLGSASSAASGLVNLTAYETGGTSRVYAKAKNFDDSVANEAFYAEITTQNGAQYPAIYADLAQATGVAINQLRQAWMTQSLLERDARGGTRYVELIRSHFGVTNPDFRLQRPEYIGGGQTPLQLTPIAQTAPTTGVPLGALGAAGTAAGSHRASYAATEHGYIIGLINIKSEISYQQGLNKLYSRETRYDFFWPAFGGLGEQAILRKEIYATGVVANDNIVFGYQERWQEYRTRTSEVTGIMRSYNTGTLDAWHLAQHFTAAPALTSGFIADIPDMERVLAAGALAENQQFLADIEYQRTATRPIPMYGTPANMGKF